MQRDCWARDCWGTDRRGVWDEAWEDGSDVSSPSRLQRRDVTALREARRDEGAIDRWVIPSGEKDRGGPGPRPEEGAKSALPQPEKKPPWKKAQFGRYLKLGALSHFDFSFLLF